MKYLNTMPWTIQIKGEPEEDSKLDCAVYEGALGQCEMLGEGLCSKNSIHYFGTSDSHDPKFCPKHYFEINGNNTNGNFTITFF